MHFNNGSNEGAGEYSGEHNGDYDIDNEATNEFDNELDAETESEVDDEIDPEVSIVVTGYYDSHWNLKSSSIQIVKSIDGEELEDLDETDPETDPEADKIDTENPHSNARHKRFDPVEDGKSEYWSGKNKSEKNDDDEWKKKNRRYRR